MPRSVGRQGQCKRPALVLAILLGIAQSQAPAPSPPAPGLDGAFEDCPCIDHHTGGDAVFFDLVERSGKVFNGTLQFTKAMVAPRDYGSSTCSAWDQGGAVVPECAGYGPPLFCSLKWCFVDPASCHPRRRPKQASLLPGMYYSYTTCHNIDSYFVGPTYWSKMVPIHVFAFGRGVGMDVESTDNAWKALAMFAHQVLNKMQVPETAIMYRPLSNSSRQLYQSEYTACARDVALGHLDLCVGDFWATEERLEMKARFSNTIYTELLYLYVRVEDKGKSFLDHLLVPLQPFTEGLWVVICSVVISAGLMMAMLEYGDPSSELARFDKRGIVWQCTYLSLSSFVNAGTAFNPSTLPGRVFAVGLAFFVCVTIASFTANTASFLLYQGLEADVGSLEEALDMGMRVCLMESMVAQILAMPKYEKLADQGVVVQHINHIFSSMEAGMCEVGILGEPYGMNYHAHGEYCQFQAVGRPVLSFPTGMFLSDRLQDAFNWATVSRRQDGTWAALETRIYPASRCSSDIDEEAQPSQLEARHMLGNCGLLLFCFAVAMVLKLLRKVEQTEAVQAVEDQVGGFALEVGEQAFDFVTSAVQEVDPIAVAAMLDRPRSSAILCPQGVSHDVEKSASRRRLRLIVSL